MAMASLSAGFFIPVFLEYLDTGMVPGFPTLIVCGFTMLAAVQSFFTGMILHTVLQKNRQDFEMVLQQASKDKREMLC